MVTLRPATRKDAKAIRSLIRAVRINPTGLNWRHFLLAVDDQDQLIGCGQIKPHFDGSHELASIAVRPGYRGQGIARMIIQQLIKSTTLPLYLTCRSELQSFYAKFGFVTILPEHMPVYFRRLWVMVKLFRPFIPLPGILSIMRLS